MSRVILNIWEQSLCVQREAGCCHQLQTGTSSRGACTCTFPCRLGGWLLALVGLVIGTAGIVRVLFYRDPISD